MVAEAEGITIFFNPPIAAEADKAESKFTSDQEAEVAV